MKKIGFVLSLLLIVIAINTAYAKPQQLSQQAITDGANAIIEDPASPCNQGQEPLKQFIKKFSKDKKFRQERSATLGYAEFDADNNIWLVSEGGMSYDTMFGYREKQMNWKNMFKPSIKVYREKDGCIMTETNSWDIIEANMAVYICDSSEECNYEKEYDDGGTLVLVFLRKDGKWHLSGCMTVG